MDKIPVFSCHEIKRHINFPTYDNSINFEMKIRFSPKFFFLSKFPLPVSSGFLARQCRCCFRAKILHLPCDGWDCYQGAQLQSYPFT